MTDTTPSLFDWSPEDHYTSYLRPTGERERGCRVYEYNPHWNGQLKNKASARTSDYEVSHEAAESVKSVDIYEVKRHADAILERRKNKIISTDIREYVLEEMEAGRMPGWGALSHVRAESMRRRFHDLCPSKNGEA